MRKTLSNFIRFLLAFMVLASAAMCIWWLPQAVEYACRFFESSNIGDGVESLVYALCALIAVPLFAVFFVSFKFPKFIENDTIFGEKTAKLLKAIGITVISDCVLFIACVILFFIMGERVLSPALAFVGAIGITVGLMLLVLSKYVERAALLKEEADCTL